MFDAAMIERSRWQFAATAMYHFIFVPLTLAVLLAIAFGIINVMWYESEQSLGESEE